MTRQRMLCIYSISDSLKRSRWQSIWTEVSNFSYVIFAWLINPTKPKKLLLKHLAQAHYFTFSLPAQGALSPQASSFRYDPGHISPPTTPSTQLRIRKRLPTPQVVAQRDHKDQLVHPSHSYIAIKYFKCEQGKIYHMTPFRFGHRFICCLALACPLFFKVPWPADRKVTFSDFESSC